MIRDILRGKLAGRRYENIDGVWTKHDRNQDILNTAETYSIAENTIVIKPDSSSQRSLFELLKLTLNSNLNKIRSTLEDNLQKDGTSQQNQEVTIERELNTLEEELLSRLKVVTQSNQNLISTNSNLVAQNLQNQGKYSLGFVTVVESITFVSGIALTSLFFNHIKPPAHNGSQADHAALQNNVITNPSKV